MALTQIVVEEDVSGHELYVSKQPGTVYTARLNAGAELSVSVPTGSNIVMFSFENNVWVSSASITFPAAGVLAANDILLNPVGIKLDTETTLYFKSRNASDIQISFWGITP